jgi:hypothetical protein
MSKDGTALLDLFRYDRIHHSTLDVGRSILDVHQFLFQFDRPSVWPAAGLNPGTLFVYLNFSVLMANRARAMAMIQNRTITFGSGQPFNSK